MMFIYVIVFFISILSCYFAEKVKKKGHKKLSILLIALAILIPAVLAGLRSRNVGTDVEFYLAKDYEMAARTDSIGDYLRVGHGEPLYSLLVYGVTKIFGNFNVLLFVVQLIIMFFAYKACSNYKDKVPVFLSYAFFLFVYYNLSLNLIRQSMALMMVFFSLKYMMNGKALKFLGIVVIASLFHITALLMLAVGVMYWLTKKIKGKGVYYGIAAFVIISILLFKEMVKILVEQGIIGQKYLYYIGSDHVDVSLAYVGFSVMILAIVLIFRKALVKNSKDNSFLIFMSILNVIMLALSFGYNNAERLTYYFALANVILVPQVVQLVREGKILTNKLDTAEKKRRRAVLVSAIYFISLGSYHFIYYAALQNHKTYPYQSNIITMQRNE